MAELEGRPKTANERVFSRTIRHAVYLQRYGVGLGNDIVGFLDEFVFPDIVAKLQVRLDRIASRGLDTGPWTTKRYKEMLGDVWNIVHDGTQESRKRLQADLRKLATVEANHAVKAMQESLPVEVGFRGLDLRSVATIVKQPIFGGNLNEWFAGIEDSLQKGIERQITIGMAQGETGEQMVRRIRGTQAAGFKDGVFSTTRRQAQAIVRTAVNHVSSQTRLQTYQENDDLLKGYQWVATLDSRTSPICRERDGKIYPVDSAVFPPAHVNCRSTVSPVLKSWRELGIDRDEAAPSTRASVNGQVPDTVTYEQWLSDQPEDVQDDVLGPTRAAAWRGGRLTWSEANAVTKTGRPVPLSDLELD